MKTGISNEQTLHSKNQKEKKKKTQTIQKAEIRNLKNEKKRNTKKKRTSAINTRPLQKSNLLNESTIIYSYENERQNIELDA